jgi:energy-converting hydrogenase Eha subunit H
MSRKEPLLAQLAVSAVLSATVAFAIPVFVDRTDYTAAVDNYARDRSPQNEATLRAERVKNQHIAMVSHLETAGALFVSLNVAWYLLRRRLSKAP